MRSTHLISYFTLATVLALTTGAASAKGRLKGAAVGVVAGHVAGHHSVLGAVGGCVVGRHMANKKAKEEASQKSGVTSQPHAASDANHVYLVDDNYRGRLEAYTGQYREAGLPLVLRTQIEGRRHARQENHGPPSTQVQATPQQAQSSSFCCQSGHQRAKRPAY